MCEEILEKNKTFILERPVHNNTTFIYFESCYKTSSLKEIFTEKISNTIDELGKISNLVFIFNSKEKFTIKYKEISTLYKAVGYIESEHPYVTQSLYYALSYFKILYERMTGFYVIPIRELEKINVSNINRVINSPITSSIFKKERTTVDMMLELFIKDEKRSFWDRVIRGKVDLKYTSGMYSRFYISNETHGFYLKPLFITEMRKFIESSEECPTYFLESFYTRCPKEFFASVSERLPENVKVLDLEIEKIEI